ncbi:hypothetical protein [Kitasatospora sp. RG8]|uniref:hypothetical protein n=1 Tax=Kitasatospora sp. RG8 TaxID=2820815 RepID=UPI001FD7AAE2|nr:hypothetical protein [Kitasatospora sp. RG8]
MPINDPDQPTEPPDQPAGPPGRPGPDDQPSAGPTDQPPAAQPPSGAEQPPPGAEQPTAAQPPPGSGQPPADQPPAALPAPGPGPEQPHADQLADLRARLAAVEAHDARLAAELKARPPAHHRVRSFFAVLLVLVVFVLTPLSLVASWTKSTITDTDRYVAMMAPLAKDPAIQAAVTNRVTDEIMKQIPVESLLSDIAPEDRPKLDALISKLSGPLTSGLTGFVHGQVERLVQSDAFATIWTTVNRQAHAAIDKMLTGEGGGAVQIKNNTVVLDLAPVIDQVKTRLVDNGLTVAAKIPQIHTDFTLVKSDAIPKVRTAFRLLDLIGFWLPVLTVLLAIAAVLLAVRRRRAAVTAALLMAAGALVLGIGLTAFRAIYLDKLPDGVDQAAAGALYDTLVRYLRSAVRVVVVLGLLVALGAWISGAGRRAGAVRGMWRAGLGGTRHAAEGAGLRLGAVGRFVHHRKSWLAWGSVVAAAVVFVLWSYPTPLVLLIIGLVLVVVLAILEFLDEPDGAQQPAH